LAKECCVLTIPYKATFDFKIEISLKTQAIKFTFAQNYIL